MPGGIDDGQRADAPVLHRGERAADRFVRGDDDRRNAQQFRERRGEAALLGHPRRIFGVQLRAQEVEQVREPPRAGVAKHVRARDERVELGGRKLEAERVAHCAVDRRHAAVAEQRAQRKHLPRRQFPEARAVARPAGSLAAHDALLDDVTVQRPLRRRLQDRFPGREVAQARSAHDAVEIALVHRAERHVGAQHLLQAGEDRGSGNGVGRHRTAATGGGIRSEVGQQSARWRGNSRGGVRS
jgi:hypothetical protein